jgi:hypothetical protein
MYEFTQALSRMLREFKTKVEDGICETIASKLTYDPSDDW